MVKQILSAAARIMVDGVLWHILTAKENRVFWSAGDEYTVQSMKQKKGIWTIIIRPKGDTIEISDLEIGLIEAFLDFNMRASAPGEIGKIKYLPESGMRGGYEWIGKHKKKPYRRPSGAYSYMAQFYDADCDGGQGTYLSDGMYVQADGSIYDSKD